MLRDLYPLFGGTMENKVVTTLARACQAIGIPTLRFNFRGVGSSAGVFTKAQAEPGMRPPSPRTAHCAGLGWKPALAGLLLWSEQYAERSKHIKKSIGCARCFDIVSDYGAFRDLRAGTGC